MLRIGVVGAGWFASRRHLPDLAAHPEVELAALCRRSPEPLARLAKHFGVRETYTDLDTMLDQARLDAVVICSPHNLHHPQAKACLAAGCHVLMEKPLALTGAEARDLVAQAASAGRILEVAYNPPYWKHARWLRERVQAGDMGAVETVDLRWSGNALALFGDEPLPDSMPGLVQPTLYRGDAVANGGGHLADAGCHPVAEVLFVTGEQPVSLNAEVDRLPDDRRYGVSMVLSGGGYAAIGSVADSPRTDRVNMGLWSGSRASALVVGRPGPFDVLWMPSDGEPRWIRDAELPAAPQPVGSFVDAILGRGEPQCPASVATAYVDVIEAAYQSAASGLRMTF
ncbi:MAG: Gfo/Idh/MocA family oxidoreductase [Armatimonadetes bacterium]|nr:Gfo/Idh/MocA family oxidoreductase [Armatimonadota bacterium]